MERVAIVGIIVENHERHKEIQEILHIYSNYVLGRMGLPRVLDNMNVISVIVKAEQSVISAMTGKLGRIDGVTCKAMYSPVREQMDTDMNKGEQ